MGIVFKKPLTFEMGLGVTGSLNGKTIDSFSMGDLSDSSNTNFKIAQAVDPKLLLHSIKYHLAVIRALL